MISTIWIVCICRDLVKSVVCCSKNRTDVILFVMDYFKRRNRYHSGQSHRSIAGFLLGSIPILEPVLPECRGKNATFSLCVAFSVTLRCMKNRRLAFQRR